MLTKVRITVSSLAAALFLLTIIVPDWIESTFGVDPDHQSGGLEKGLAAAALLGVLAFALSPAIQRARDGRRRRKSDSSGALKQRKQPA